VLSLVSLVSCVWLWPAVEIALLDSVRVWAERVWANRLRLVADAADCWSVDVRSCSSDVSQVTLHMLVH